MSPFLKQSLVVTGAALNIAGHGCAHGYPAVLFAQLRGNGTSTIKLTDHDTSWIAASAGIMGFIGNFISSMLMAKYGRQKVHLLTTLPAIFGWIVFIFADSVPMFILARVLHGLALGLRTPLAAILVAEYTDPKFRGSFLGTFAISLGLGIFLSHVWGSILTWQMTSLACSIFPLLAMIIISFSPESPSWLVSKGRYSEATNSFIWLRGDNEKSQRELEEMVNTHKMEVKMMKKNNTHINIEEIKLTSITKTFIEKIKTLIKIFKKKSFIKPAIVAITMLVIFEFGGAHVFPAYGNLILLSALGKSDPNDVNMQFTAMDLLRTVSAFIALFLLKYFRRRTILFTSGIMTIASMLSISIFIYLRDIYCIKESLITETVPLVLMVVYTLSFCLGLVPLTWVICGEVFPLSYRSLGSAVSTSMLTPSFIISMKTAPHLFSSVGVEGAFVVYAAILMISLIVIYCLLPETKDRTLQDIERSFRKRFTVDNTEVDVQLIDHNNKN